MNGGTDPLIHVLSTSEDEWSASHPDRFTSGERTPKHPKTKCTLRNLLMFHKGRNKIHVKFNYLNVDKKNSVKQFENLCLGDVRNVH